GGQKKQRKTGQPDQAGQSGPQIHPHRDPVIGHPPRRGGSQPQGEGKAVEDDRKAESFGEPSHGEAGGGESDRSPQPETAVVEAVSHRVIDGEGVRDGNDGALAEGEGGGGGQQGEVFVKEQEAQADSSRGQKGGDQHRAGAAGPVADQSPYGLGDHHDDGADGHQGADLTAAQADLFLQVNAQQGVKPPEGPEGQKIKQTEVGLDGSVACGHGFSSTPVYFPCAE